MSDVKFTLDNLRAAAEKKYASTPIELPDGNTVTLVNVMSLPKAKRTELLATQKRLSSLSDEGNEDEADQTDLLEDALRIVAKGEGQGDRLVEAIGGDLAVLATVFETYTRSTELGEASASAS